jgi:tetratricopeptide (TPR) repeat protein
VQRALRAASTADDLFHAALDSEEIGATADAESAYRNAIAADPKHVSAHINLGRLRHSAQSARGASGSTGARSSSSRTIRPRGSISGVVLEDRGATRDAIEQYLEAVRLDARVADVHFNLARLYQQVGDEQAALRHFSRFRALTRDRKD